MKYCSAVAIVFGPDKYYTLFDDSSSSEHYLYDHDVDIEREGFPLDAISRIHMNSVRTDGYRNFIKECLDKS